MLKKIACVVSMLISSSAMSGIIGVGGTNADYYSQILEALDRSERVTVEESDFRRLAARLGGSPLINAEVTATTGRKIRRDFIKVVASGEVEVVDKDIQIKLAPKGP